MKLGVKSRQKAPTGPNMLAQGKEPRRGDAALGWGRFHPQAPTGRQNREDPRDARFYAAPLGLWLFLHPTQGCAILRADALRMAYPGLTYLAPLGPQNLVLRSIDSDSDSLRCVI
jgi:hypothetical protein